MRRLCEGAAHRLEYRYDERGNVITAAANSTPNRHFQYDGLSRIKTISAGAQTARYTYGPEGDVIAFAMAGAARS